MAQCCLKCHDVVDEVGPTDDDDDDDNDLSGIPWSWYCWEVFS